MIESFYKVNIKGDIKELVSAVDESTYATRFEQFMYKEIIVNEDNQNLNANKDLLIEE